MYVLLWDAICLGCTGNHSERGLKTQTLTVMYLTVKVSKQGILGT